jgi:hypothetical protein
MVFYARLPKDVMQNDSFSPLSLVWKKTSMKLEKNIDIDSYHVDKEDRLIRQTNRQGRLWLHELIISGNARALELALSPVALGWTTLSSIHWGKLKFEIYVTCMDLI